MTSSSSDVSYDTETAGLDARNDQIIQLAGIRTDSVFNDLGRINLRCRLSGHLAPATGPKVCRCRQAPEERGSRTLTACLSEHDENPLRDYSGTHDHNSADLCPFVPVCAGSGNPENTLIS
jgi:hypothetical protein